jgi:hypothetical protein
MLFPLSLNDFGMFLGEKWFLENFEFFMNVLDILAKNKKVWSFDSNV